MRGLRGDGQERTDFGEGLKHFLLLHQRLHHLSDVLIELEGDHAQYTHSQVQFQCLHVLEWGTVYPRHVRQLEIVHQALDYPLPNTLETLDAIIPFVYQILLSKVIEYYPLFYRVDVESLSHHSLREQLVFGFTSVVVHFKGPTGCDICGFVETHTSSSLLGEVIPFVCLVHVGLGEVGVIVVEVLVVEAEEFGKQADIHLLLQIRD